MNNKLKAYIALGSVVIGGSAVMASSAFAQAPGAAGGQVAPVTTPGARGLRALGQKNEKHPELKKAMRALNNALRMLQNADSDFGGHKASAIKSTQDAIAEVKAAMAFDRH